MLPLPDGVNGAVHLRPLAIILPEDPSQEELAQYWTLSTQDKQEVFKCRGETQRRRFAVQLCTLRAYGRFLPKAVAAPTVITNHLARQLDLPLVLFGEVPGRLATETTISSVFGPILAGIPLVMKAGFASSTGSTIGPQMIWPRVSWCHVPKICYERGKLLCPLARPSKNSWRQ
jgi:hypothetical protein